MFDNAYLDGAAFGNCLQANLPVHEEFLKAIGVLK